MRDGVNEDVNAETRRAIARTRVATATGQWEGGRMSLT